MGRGPGAGRRAAAPWRLGYRDVTGLRAHPSRHPGPRSVAATFVGPWCHGQIGLINLTPSPHVTPSPHCDGRPSHGPVTVTVSDSESVHRTAYPVTVAARAPGLQEIFALAPISTGPSLAGLRVADLGPGPGLSLCGRILPGLVTSLGLQREWCIMNRAHPAGHGPAGPTGKGRSAYSRPRPSLCPGPGR